MTQESTELHMPDNRLLCIAPLQGTQFILNMHAANQSNANATAGGDSAPESRTWLEWHHALSHASIQALQTMHQQNLVDGMKIIPSPQNFVCEGCIQGKHTSKPLPCESKNKYKEIGDLVVTDLWGPAPIEGKGGLNYYISFTDAATRYSVITFLKDKSEAFNHYWCYAARIQTQYNCKIKAACFDSGSEYLNQQMKNFLTDQGTLYMTMAPNTSVQNGIAEQLNCTMLECAHAMIYDSGLPQNLWPWAISYSCYIRNHTPTAALDGKTPYEIFVGRKPDVSKLYPFGCDIWVKDQSDKYTKLDPKSN